MDTLDITWCGPEAAGVVHAVTLAAFAPQAALDPPSSATRETVEIVEADLAEGRGVLARLGPRTVAAARVLLRNDHLHLRRLAVHPDFHRRGVAMTVMRWVHYQAALLGFSEVRLGVRNALPANLALYRRLGYEEMSDHGYWTELRLGVERSDRPAPSTHL